MMYDLSVLFRCHEFPMTPWRHMLETLGPTEEISRAGFDHAWMTMVDGCAVTTCARRFTSPRSIFRHGYHWYLLISVDPNSSSRARWAQFVLPHACLKSISECVVPHPREERLLVTASEYLEFAGETLSREDALADHLTRMGLLTWEGVPVPMPNLETLETAA